MQKYDHTKIEKKWQKEWSKAELYKTPDEAFGPAAAKAKAGKKDNFHLLVEFPYPSGNLHVGHWYAFALPDILARALRMQGKNVLYPIGFDAFGLPAENAAIKNKLNPRKWTEENIAYMKKQIASMGASFDWSREVITCNPDYYKWTQWLFLQLFKKGLAYQKDTAVNWCPKDKTVLANEQVTDGKCERCGTEVVQKDMLQWNIKITDYADRLIDDLAPLNWPEQIKESQRNWIGRSEGAEIDFPLTDTGIKRIVLLHGKGGSPEGGPKLWLKKKLEALGYEVQVPQLPNTNEPDDEEQADYVEKHCTLDEETAIVGHSFGGIVALRLLERGVKVKRVALVSTPFSGKYLDGKERPTVTAAINKGFDFEKIKKQAGFVALYDVGDHVVPISDGEAFAERLGCYLMRGKASESHYNGAQEPDVLSVSVPAIRVFTTRPDTLFGATYLVLAPEHPWIHQLLASSFELLDNSKEVQKYITQSQKKTDMDRQTSKEKTGVQLEGVEAINPATGENIPIFIADYVLGHYGTGAIMAVPAHDERDFEFARKYKLLIKKVVQPMALLNIVRNAEDIASGATVSLRVESTCWTEDGELVNSEKFNGMTSEKARHAITEVFGVKKTTYKLRDWIVSRQRYWGVPIPIIHCEKCGTVPVPDKNLPVVLPEIEDYLPEGSGKSPLAKVRAWVEVKCPQCGGRAERETDTLDTFVDSSWYFLRYTDPKNEKEFASKESQENWVPVDLYSGGAEHTTMHVLYSRFWHKALYDLGLVKDSEPYTRRMNRSLILGPDGQKMSKSRGNVVDPDDAVARFGADTVRLYLAFIGPYNEVSSYPWNPNGVVGIRRFLERVCRAEDTVVAVDVSELNSTLHKTIKKVGEDIAALKLNTAVSALMILLNSIEKARKIGKEQFGTFLKLLAPFAPHLAEELWRGQGNSGFIHQESWPVYDASHLKDDVQTIIVQVNGKMRASIEVSADAADKETVERLAREAVAERLKGKEIARIIAVPNRLVNFVLK
ncbi:MAG: leucine--tRNA ligase [bacterium]|nr:leucine--tRNA ligase [bacterium]